MRGYLTYFGATVALILALTIGLSLFFEPFLPLIGDLTRVGNYAEKDFGWHAPKPVLQIEENGQQIIAPDVLVLGDSFAVRNVWQSVLGQKLHAKVQSFEYADVGCIQNWVDYALNQSSAKTIVIESVERVFAPRFQSVAPCKSVKPIAFPVNRSLTAATPRTWPPEWHIYRTFKVAYNTTEMMRRPTATRRGGAVNAPIDMHCAKFSNRRADRILYFPQDEEKFQWRPEKTASAVANILRIQKLFSDHGKKFVFMVVPDKLSTYQNCLLNDSAVHAANRKSVVFNQLISAGVNTPDMLTAFRTNAGSIDDLYMPNDTHISEAGYALMAEQLAQFVLAK